MRITNDEVLRSEDGDNEQTYSSDWEMDVAWAPREVGRGGIHTYLHTFIPRPQGAFQ